MTIILKKKIAIVLIMPRFLLVETSKFYDTYIFVRSDWLIGNNVILRIIFIIVILIFVALYNVSYAFRNSLNQIYAQTSDRQDMGQQGPFKVTIPKGGANPEVDITNLSPRHWYVPKQVSISQGDAVTWINNDTEAHTVTSGTGAGIESLLTNKQGKPNGIFDSGLFDPGESWTHNFTDAGRYAYFCTIHPWMDGIVTVALDQGKSQQQQNQIEIPTYPVNASGSRIDKFPVYKFTNDNKYEIGMSWDPGVIVVGEPVSFLINSFDWPTNRKSHLVPYDFVITRNGTEMDSTSDLIEVDADAQSVVFDKPGPITIGVENVGNTPASAEFSTIIYENSNGSERSGISSANSGIISDQSNVSKFISPLTLVYATYAIIAVLPAGVAAIVILYLKGKI
jgi:plastocyanin